jgi:hypothetical protein
MEAGTSIMIRTLISILEEEKRDLDDRLRREATAPRPDDARLESLRTERDSLERQLERLAER